MKNIVQIVLVFLSILVLGSCSNTQVEDASNSIKLENDTTYPPVELNDGEKWATNPETTAGINNMTAIIGQFKGGDRSVFVKLQQDLEHEFGDIFKNCTMNGEAHNQLHNYLLPMRDMFKALEDQDQSRRERAVLDLIMQLEDYDTYFTTEASPQQVQQEV